KMYTDHVRQQQIHRLPQHRRFGFDSADAETHYTEAIDHGRVRVGADERIRIHHAICLDDVPRQELEVHLVTDAEPWRDDPQSVKRLCAPLQEPVAPALATEIHVRIEPQGIGPAEVIDLYGVIDHEIHGNRRLHALDVHSATC